ncbi:MAG: hypothetical protein Q7S74_06220 [Nanoarchaeota archaeon]|nr:hypothetical protein [Nanoarchaeota archaeon]
MVLVFASDFTFLIFGNAIKIKAIPNPNNKDSITAKKIKNGICAGLGIGSLIGGHNTGPRRNAGIATMIVIKTTIVKDVSLSLISQRQTREILMSLTIAMLLPFFY